MGFSAFLVPALLVQQFACTLRRSCRLEVTWGCMPSMSLSRLLTSLNNSLDSKLQRAVIHQASSLEWRHSELEPTCDARHLAATVCIAKGLRAVLVSRSLLFFAW